MKDSANEYFMHIMTFQFWSFHLFFFSQVHFLFKLSCLNLYLSSIPGFEASIHYRMLTSSYIFIMHSSLLQWEHRICSWCLFPEWLLGLLTHFIMLHSCRWSSQTFVIYLWLKTLRIHLVAILDYKTDGWVRLPSMH